MSAYHDQISKMVWSFSRVKCFDNCRKEFKMNYIDKLEKADNAFASYGLLVHELLEDYYNGQCEFFELAGRFRNEYDEKVQEDFPIFYGKDLGEGYYKAGQDYFDHFEDDFSSYNILGVEEQIKMDIGGYPFTGFIDLVLEDADGNITIIDHKSKNGFSSKREKNEYLRQLYLYSLHVHEKYGKWPVKLGFNMVRVPKIEWADFNEEALHEAIEWFTSTIEQIHKEEKFADKIALSYKAAGKKLSEFKRQDFYCNSLCNMREHCGRSQKPRDRKGRR